MAHNKRFAAAASAVDPAKAYSLTEAVGLIKSAPSPKFDESIDLAMNLGVDPRHADQMVRGAIVLPHGIGKDTRVLVFAKGPKEAEARNAGADFVGGEDLAKKITDEGWLNSPYRSVRFFIGTDQQGQQPEQYPNTRSSNAASIRAKYFLPYRAAIDGMYRYYTDTWGIVGHTAELGYVHPLDMAWAGGNWIFEGRVRYYRQTAADFYMDIFPRADFSNFMARDKETSALTGHTVGIGAAYEFPVTFAPWIKRGTANAQLSRMMVDYDQFRDLRGLPREGRRGRRRERGRRRAVGIRRDAAHAPSEQAQRGSDLERSVRALPSARPARRRRPAVRHLRAMEALGLRSHRHHLPGLPRDGGRRRGHGRRARHGQRSGASAHDRARCRHAHAKGGELSRAARGPARRPARSHQASGRRLHVAARLQAAHGELKPCNPNNSCSARSYI